MSGRCRGRESCEVQCCMDEPAPDLTPAEAARVAEFEEGQPAPESWRGHIDHGPTWSLADGSVWIAGGRPVAAGGPDPTIRMKGRT